MDAHTVAVLIFGSAGLAFVVWLLHKLGKALAAIAEAIAAAWCFAVWWLLKEPGIGGQGTDPGRGGD